MSLTSPLAPVVETVRSRARRRDMNLWDVLTMLYQMEPPELMEPMENAALLDGILPADIEEPPTKEPM